MKYVVDSDGVIDYLNGQRRAVALIAALVDDGFGISLLTVGKIHEGMLGSGDPKLADAAFQRLLRTVTVVPLNREIMRRYGQIRRQLRDVGQLIGDFDIAIAATALHHDLTLVSRNLDHFRRIPELRIYPAT